MTNNKRYDSRYDYRRNDRYNYNERGYDRRREDGYVDIYSSRARMPHDRRKSAPQKHSDAGVVIAAIAISLVAVIAATVLAIGSFTVQPMSGSTQPTIAIAAVADKDVNKSVQNNDTPAQQTAVKSDDQSTGQNDSIQIINGERVYIDTKRTAPAVTGNSADYYAYGKTSYGFDWNYSADNGNFVIRCDYNFDRQQYMFHFYGVTPGTSHITLLYNTDDNTQVPVDLTLTVDNDLNASIA